VVRAAVLLLHPEAQQLVLECVAAAPAASEPRGADQAVGQDCQHLFGSSAANRMQEDFGRLRGSGMTRPAAVRYRLTVAADTRTW
jgi:hypothetical protein